jgi:hypothetical protein
LCDKVFLDKPKPSIGGEFIFLGDMVKDVRIYGVVDDSGSARAEIMQGTLELTIPFANPVEGGKLHALG